MGKFGHLVGADSKIWEATHATFNDWGVTNRDRAAELWKYGWEMGWVSHSPLNTSIKEVVDSLCQKAQKEGVLHRFQEN